MKEFTSRMKTNKKEYERKFWNTQKRKQLIIRKKKLKTKKNRREKRAKKKIKE